MTILLYNMTILLYNMTILLYNMTVFLYNMATLILLLGVSDSHNNSSRIPHLILLLKNLYLGQFLKNIDDCIHCLMLITSRAYSNQRTLFL